MNQRKRPVPCPEIAPREVRRALVSFIAARARLYGGMWTELLDPLALEAAWDRMYQWAQEQEPPLRRLEWEKPFRWWLARQVAERGPQPDEETTCERT